AGPSRASPNRTGVAESRTGTVLRAEARLCTRGSDDRHLGHGKDEFAAATAEFGLLTEDLGRKVPCQQQHIIGPAFEQRIRRQDRQVIAGRETALLELIAIDYELDQSAVDAERVHQCASLGGCTISRDALTLLFQPLQQRQQLLLEARNALGEVAVVFEAENAFGLLLRQQLSDALRCL